MSTLTSNKSIKPHALLRSAIAVAVMAATLAGEMCVAAEKQEKKKRDPVYAMKRAMEALRKDGMKGEFPAEGWTITLRRSETKWNIGFKAVPDEEGRVIVGGHMWVELRDDGGVKVFRGL